MAKMQPGDPAYWMLKDPKSHSQPVVYFSACYICRDDEYMRMGLPLCRECCVCKRKQENRSPTLPINPKNPQVVYPGYGHIPADDVMCDFCEHECGPDNPECDYYNPQEAVDAQGNS